LAVRQLKKRHRRGSSNRIAAGAGLAGVVLVCGLAGWAIAARAFAPKANTKRTRFDAIIVLGTPADADGNPTPKMLDRVTEGVREYQAGVAPRLILTGAASHRKYVEAEVMARVAESQGVPEAVIFKEPQAMDTIQNACYSARIMKENGWQSAEVVSSEYHLARSAMIFSEVPIEWRMHATPGTLSSGLYRGGAEIVETVKTVRYLTWSKWAERCAP